MWKQLYIWASKHDPQMARPKDDLPLLEKVRHCRCPRVYIPVCGSNNESYTNICKMNCLNERLGYDKAHIPVKLKHMGVCDTYLDIFSF